MLAPTVPVAQASLTAFVITQVVIVLEPALQVTIMYAPSDGTGNVIGPPVQVILGGAALTAFQNTAGSPKAKLYAALQTHVPALAGVVT